MHLYEEQGAECIERLDGMFGLAIWDESKGRLILARDRAGKKLDRAREDAIVAHLTAVRC